MKDRGRCFGVEVVAGPPGQQQLIGGITRINLREIPCASDNIRVGFARTGTSFKHDEGLYIHRAVGQQGALRLRVIRGDPYTVLQVTKPAVVQVHAEFVTRAPATLRHVKEHKSPASIPFPFPLRYRVAPTQGVQAARLRQPVQTGTGTCRLTFEQLLPFQSLQLPEKAVSVRPTLKRFCQVPEGGSRNHFASPEQHPQ